MKSIELKSRIYITGHRLKNPIDFGECLMRHFLKELKKIIYITVYGVKVSLKCSSIQTVHSIELKFGTYITGRHRTNLIDFVNVK